MRQALPAALGSLALIVALTGCAEVSATSATVAPVRTSQQECERGGGVWRATFCESSGGGGY
jgi:hypothetical protein